MYAVLKRDVLRCRNPRLLIFDDEINDKNRIGHCRGFMLRLELTGEQQ